mmetsp:Transcript_6245/g.15542  ORF Transcript_6245/g.15542 Transcript_6245/m.15542 type:complete len:281 (-) Transcript_6245:411-1253(-)
MTTVASLAGIDFDFAGTSRVGIDREGRNENILFCLDGEHTPPGSKIVLKGCLELVAICLLRWLHGWLHAWLHCGLHSRLLCWLLWWRLSWISFRLCCRSQCRIPSRIQSTTICFRENGRISKTHDHICICRFGPEINFLHEDCHIDARSPPIDNTVGFAFRKGCLDPRLCVAEAVIPRFSDRDLVPGIRHVPVNTYGPIKPNKQVIGGSGFDFDDHRSVIGVVLVIGNADDGARPVGTGIVAGVPRDCFVVVLVVPTVAAPGNLIVLCWVITHETRVIAV